jgi:hypothetical protein
MNIRPHRRTLAFFALLCIVISFAHADPADTSVVAGEFCSRPVTLDEFRALALSHSPLVSEIDSEYARDVSQAYEIEVLKNPEIQFEQAYTRMKLGGDSDPQTNASLALPLTSVELRREIACRRSA